MLNVLAGLGIAVIGFALCILSQSPAGAPAFLGGILVACLSGHDCAGQQNP
jgi:hypothetical protein